MMSGFIVIGIIGILVFAVMLVYGIVAGAAILRSPAYQKQLDDEQWEWVNKAYKHEMTGNK